MCAFCCVRLLFKFRVRVVVVLVGFVKKQVGCVFGFPRTYVACCCLVVVVVVFVVVFLLSVWFVACFCLFCLSCVCAFFCFSCCSCLLCLLIVWLLCIKTCCRCVVLF